MRKIPWLTPLLFCQYFPAIWELYIKHLCCEQDAFDSRARNNCQQGTDSPGHDGIANGYYNSRCYLTNSDEINHSGESQFGWRTCHCIHSKNAPLHNIMFHIINIGELVAGCYSVNHRYFRGFGWAWHPPLSSCWSGVSHPQGIFDILYSQIMHYQQGN
jgi:hypothetical protein